MGPPLASWRKEVRVFRYGEPCCTHMLTQQGTPKAPKWTFGGKRKDPEEGNLYPGPDHCPEPQRYANPPAYSFPGRGRPSRPQSAPPGPKYEVPLNPSTPKWSFSKVERPHPFAPPDGPGPENPRRPTGGPRYSFGKVPPGKKVGPPGPGPSDYRPRRPKSAHGVPMGPPPRPTKEDPRGPGPTYVPHPGPGGPSYSFRPKLEEKPDDHWRQLGPPWTYFGYNDFGHSGCENCHEPDYGKTGGLAWSTQVRGYVRASPEASATERKEASLDQTGSVGSKRRTRPASAPAGRGQRVPH